MATRLYNTLFPVVQMHVDGCPPPTMINAIRQAAIFLCQQGLVWRTDLDPINAVALTPTYTIVPPTDTRVQTIIVVRYNNVPIKMTRIPSLRMADPLQPDTTNVADPTNYYQLTPQSISLKPVPQTSLANAIKIFAAVTPTEASTGMDNEVMTDYSETLMHGALYRLFMIPKRPWTDVKLADFHGRKFRSDVFAAKARVEIGYTQSDLVVTPPRIV